ncbi:MAG: hypothetical protein ACJA0N_000544 [Pseudohongiellaceae bacterium]|jgi:hypothetical protein
MIQQSVKEIFVDLDIVAAGKRFEQLTASEDFIDLNSRRKLDEVCFQVATNWPNETEFPGIVFRAMAEEFSWFRPNGNSDWDPGKMDYLFNRLRAYDRFIDL